MGNRNIQLDFHLKKKEWENISIWSNPKNVCRYITKMGGKKVNKIEHISM